MASNIVFVLLLVGYNSISHEVTSNRTVNWHMSHSDCIQEKTHQNNAHRRETFNQSYVCLRVQDSAMRARVQRATGRSHRHSNSGLHITIQIN